LATNLEELMTGSGNALAFLGREAKSAGNSVVGLAGNLLSGSMKLSDYSKALDTNTKILGNLGKVVNALTMFAENSLAEYQSLTGIGASFGKQMTEIKIAAAEFGMTVEDMTKLLKDNTEGLSAFGGTTDQAISRFRQFSSSVLASDVGTNLRRLGFTVEDINENLLTYAEIAEQDNQLERSVGRDRNASALEFAKELDALSKLTGKQREDLADQMKEARRQGDVQAFLTGQSADASEALTTGLTKISSTMGPQFSELFKDLLIRGAPTTDDTRQAFVALGDSADEFQAQVDAFRQGMNTNDFSAFDQSISNTQAAFTDYLNTEEARQIGMLGNLTGISQAQNQLREDSYVFANRLNAAGAAAEDTLVKLQRITAEIEKQQEIQMSAADTKNLIDETIRLNEATQKMVLATQQTALKNLEEMGVSALQKVQAAMPSVGEITNNLGGVVDNLFRASENVSKVYEEGTMAFENMTNQHIGNVENMTVGDTGVATGDDVKETAETLSTELTAARKEVMDTEQKIAQLQFRQTEATLAGQSQQAQAIAAEIDQMQAELSQAIIKTGQAFTKARINDYKTRGFTGRGFADGGYIRSGEIGVTGEMGPELISGPGNVLSTENTRNLVTAMRGLRSQIDNNATSSYNSDTNAISNSITDTMVSMLEGKLNTQNSLLESLLRVESGAADTSKRQYRATKGLSGNMLKGIGT